MTPEKAKYLAKKHIYQYEGVLSAGTTEQMLEAVTTIRNAAADILTEMFYEEERRFKSRMDESNKLLKPCMRCNGSAEILDFGEKTPYIQCKKCGLLSPDFRQKKDGSSDAINEAVEFWNTRAGE